MKNYFVEETNDNGSQGWQYSFETKEQLDDFLLTYERHAMKDDDFVLYVYNLTGNKSYEDYIAALELEDNEEVSDSDINEFVAENPDLDCEAYINPLFKNYKNAIGGDYLFKIEEEEEEEEEEENEEE